MAFLRAIGLMSGTSMDGVDVALIETDGQGQVVTGPSSFRPYAPTERAVLRQALVDASTLTARSHRPGVLGQAEALVTQAHIEAVQAFLAQHAIAAETVDLIGFHGQTVLHRPEAHLTVQIGDGAELARQCGRPVIFDFRAADVAAGGQGAPLVPIYHQALVAQARREGHALPDVVALLNIGGVSNATIMAHDGHLVATDVGPGNALIDDFMLARCGLAFDENGALAAKGRVNETVLKTMLAHAFFASPLPKSLDRNAFASHLVEPLSDEDGAATLTAFTAHAIARIVPHLNRAPEAWIVCGGGAHNPVLMKMLGEALQASVLRAEDFGWATDAIEAQAFAYLAVRSQLGLPITFPQTTGVAVAMTGGVRVEPGDHAQIDEIKAGLDEANVGIFASENDVAAVVAKYTKR